MRRRAGPVPHPDPASHPNDFPIPFEVWEVFVMPHMVTRDCKTRERLQAELRFEQAVADGSLDGSSYSGGGGYGFGYGGAYSDEMAAHARRYSDDNDGAASGYGFEYDVGEADLGGAEFWG